MNRKPCLKPTAALWTFKEKNMKQNKSNFEVAICLAIAAVVAGCITKKEALQSITETRDKVQLDLECLNQGIETIKNLNIKEGFQNDRN